MPAARSACAVLAADARALRLPGRADGRLGRRRGNDAPAARDGAALLVDREEERHFLLCFSLRIRLQLLAQRLELILRLDVAVEIHNAADMELPQHGLAVLIELRAVNADHDHLADLFIRRHRCDDRVGLLLERLRLGRLCRLLCRRHRGAAAGAQSDGHQSRAEQRAERHAPADISPHRSHASCSSGSMGASARTHRQEPLSALIPTAPARRTGSPPRARSRCRWGARGRARSSRGCGRCGP